MIADPRAMISLRTAADAITYIERLLSEWDPPEITARDLTAVARLMGTVALLQHGAREEAEIALLDKATAAAKVDYPRLVALPPRGEAM